MPWYNMTVACKACQKYLDSDEPFFEHYQHDPRYTQTAYNIIFLELYKELSFIDCIARQKHNVKIKTAYQQNPPYHEPDEYKMLREADKLIDEIIAPTA